MDERACILELLSDGPVPALRMFNHFRHRAWKHALHDLEYEGKIWRDWHGNYALRDTGDASVKIEPHRNWHKSRPEEPIQKPPLQFSPGSDTGDTDD